MAAPATPLVHLKVQVSGILSATVQELWDVLRDYAQAQTWLGTYRGVKTFTTLLVSSRLRQQRLKDFFRAAYC